MRRNGPSVQPRLGGLSTLALSIAAGFSIAIPAFALQPGDTPHLTASGPVSPQTNYPIYYQDHTGLALELCTVQNDVAGMCLIVPPEPADPYQVQVGFSDEAFWSTAEMGWTVTPSAECPDCRRGLFLFAVEAAYAAAQAPGEEISFGRMRIRIDAPFAGRYKITHPFGEKIVEVPEAGIKAINITEDVLGQTPDFSGPLRSMIGAFLVWDPNAEPKAPTGYIGDPNVEHRVIGGTFTDPTTGQPMNKLRIEYLDGQVDLDGAGNNFWEFTDWAVSGLIYGGTTPTPLKIARASFSDGRAEVFVDSSNDATVTVSFDDRPAVTLVGDGNGRYYTATAMSEMPSLAHVVAKDPDNQETFVNGNVVDVVTISTAQYDPMQRTLLISAKSSNPGASTVLTATGYGTIDPASGSLAAAMVKSAPAWVEVTSSLGGSGRLPVRVTAAAPAGTSGGTPPAPPPLPAGNQLPVAQNDTVSTVADTAVAIDVAANDRDTDGTLNRGSIKIVQPPVNGTIGLIGVAGIQYIPGVNFAGAGDSFTYTIADNQGGVSNAATVTVNPIAAQVTIAQSEYRRSSGWRVRGTTNAVNNTATVTLVSATGQKTVVGTGPVDPTGAFDIRVGTTPAPAAGGTVTIAIGKAVTLSGVAVTIRN